MREGGRERVGGREREREREREGEGGRKMLKYNILLHNLCTTMYSI